MPDTLVTLCESEQSLKMENARYFESRALNIEEVNDENAELTIADIFAIFTKSKIVSVSIHCYESDKNGLIIDGYMEICKKNESYIFPINRKKNDVVDLAQECCVSYGIPFEIYFI